MTKLTLTLREEKKLPLTSKEMDNNFILLDKAIESLEDKFEGTDHIQSFQLIDNKTLLFQRKNGDSFSLHLDEEIPLFKGQWLLQKNYTRGDIVFSDNKIFLCHTTHDGQESFEKKFWHILGDQTPVSSPTEVNDEEKYNHKNPNKQSKKNSLSISPKHQNFSSEPSSNNSHHQSPHKNSMSKESVPMLSLKTLDDLYQNPYQKGQIAFLIKYKRQEPVYFDGENWRFFSDHSIPMETLSPKKK